MGRVTGSSQSSGGSFSYTYDVSGAMSSVTYPSGRKLTDVFDAAGRVSQLSGFLSGTTTNYTSATALISYAPQGAMQSVSLNNGLTESWTFNTRQQPSGVNAVNGTTTVMSLGFGYGGTGNASPSVCADVLGSNNGNVICQSITRSSGLSVPVTQRYAYNDPANRLTGFGETGGCAQTYGYDAFGNRGVTAASTCVVSGTDVTSQPGEFTNNRWTKFAATLYDASGNLKQTATRTNQTTPSNFFTYDGENRMITSNVGGMGTVNYVYDGQGRRVQKWWTAGNCPGNPATCTTTYVYL